MTSTRTIDPVFEGERRRTGALVDRVRALPGGALDAAAVALLALLAVVRYLPYATSAGWFIDDWTMYSLFKDANGGALERMDACVAEVPGGRKLTCVYHVAEWSLFGDDRVLYHLAAIALLALTAALAYALLRCCRLARPWALTVAVLIVLFPASDTARLWPVATIGQYVVVLWLVSVLLAIAALRARRRGAAIALHVAAALLAILAMASYEIAVPLVALGGVAYVVAEPGRPALIRAAADIGLVLLFVGYRLLLDPVPEGALRVERSADESVTRAGRLLEGTWDVWRFVYAPGRALLLVGGLVLVVAVVALLDARFRHRARRWFLMLAVAIVGLAACVLVFLPAHDTYVPDVGSTFNRLNLPGTLAFALSFTALAGLGYELVRRFSPWAVVAPLAVVLVLAGVAKHQIGVGRQHERAWEQSWRVSSQALDGYRAALVDVPPTALIVGFDTPLYEEGWIPNLSTSWDLRGAIDYETSLDPPAAMVWNPAMSCGPAAVTGVAGVDGEYGASDFPVYFVSPRRRTAVRVTSRQRCERLLADWGAPPLWGRSVSG